MDRTELHRAILGALLDLRPSPVAQVRLVARLHDEALLGGDDLRRFFVFLPDFHLVSARRGNQFQFGFDKVREGRWLDRAALLEALGKALVDLADNHVDGIPMKTVQVGDFIDLWRERRRNAADGVTEDVQTMVSRVLDDHPAARQRVVRVDQDSLQADLLLGNHDPDSGASNDLARAKRSIIYPVGTARSLLVTHGDLFDHLELTTSDALQRFMVRNFAEFVGGSVYPADRTGSHEPGSITGAQGGSPGIVQEPDDDDDWSPSMNVWVTRADATEDDLRDSHELLPLAVEQIGLLRSGNANALRQFGLAAARHTLGTVVVGHSHQARLCIHRDPAHPENDLCLMDCGAWIEEMHFGPGKDDDRVPSCTIGVLAGGDARIYQLDPSADQFSSQPPQ